MKQLFCHNANNSDDVTQIVFEKPIDFMLSQDSLEEIMQKESVAIEDMLYKTLPMGVYNRLASKIIDRLAGVDRNTRGS
jgi:hypothetical protein